MNFVISKFFLRKKITFFDFSLLFLENERSLMNLIEKVLRKEIERTSAPESLFRIDSTATRLLGELFRLEGFDSFYHQLRNYFLFLFLTSFTFYCYYCFSVLCSFLNHISFLVGIDWLHSALESHVNAVCHKPGNFLIKKKTLEHCSIIHDIVLNKMWSFSFSSSFSNI